MKQTGRFPLLTRKTRGGGSVRRSGRDAEAASGTAVTERARFLATSRDCNCGQKDGRNDCGTTTQPGGKPTPRRGRGGSVRGEEAEEDKEQKTLAVGSYEDK